MLNHTFTFNGHSSDEFGIRIERFPDLNRSARKFRSASVSGRNGNIYQFENAWEEVTVSYQIFAGERQEGAAVSDFTEIVEWLNSADDYAELTDSYDPEHYRLAVFVDEMEIESEWHTFGKATVRFRCRPQRYLNYSIRNILPKMTEISRTYNGVTGTVNADGVATISGTATSNTSVKFDLANSLTFTEDMVGLTISLNNSQVSEGMLRFYRQFAPSSFSPFLDITLDEINKTTTVTEDMVGLTLLYYLWVSRGDTVGGTFKPVMRIDSRILDLTSGDIIENPTNHIAHPIITLTGRDVYPNMANLEIPYTTEQDDYTTINSWNSKWVTNISFINMIKRQYTNRTDMEFHTYSAPTAAGLGGSLTTHTNSTGTLTFTIPEIIPALGDFGIGIGVTLTQDSYYTISCNTSKSGAFVRAAIFSADDGSYYSTSYAAGGTALKASLTFYVPPNCSKVLLLFYPLSSDRSSVSFSNIMLTAGTEQHSFLPYATSESTESFTLNGITLSFQTAGFNTAIIDCERENFTVDGINYNNKSTITDQYGNIAVDYMRLVQGDNAVTYTENITAASMDPRVWEL